MAIIAKGRARSKPGDLFGQWTVLGRPFTLPKKIGTRVHVVAECACGKVSVVSQHDLTSGHSGSCGCTAADKRVTHGHTRNRTQSRLYSIWKDMRSRCRHKRSQNYRYYGGRGIIVCQEWQEFGVFRDWALANGYEEHLEIDRRENGGNYCPENCRWVTRKQQNRNTRFNRIVEAFGEAKPLCEWVEDHRCSLSYAALKARLDLGWAPETAIATPGMGKNGRLRNGTRYGRLATRAAF